MRLRVGVFAFVIACWPLWLAHADTLAFELTPSTLSTNPGGIVEFTGTLANTGINDVYLNGVVSILPYTFLTVDPSPFFMFSPLFLPGGGSYIGPFFDVLADGTAPLGTYSGSFTIQGGSDSSAFNDLASQTFQVTVTNVPEPASMIMLGSGVLGMGYGVRRRLMN